MAELIAVSYADSSVYFTFDSLEDYGKKSEKMLARGHEEFEVSFQDGTQEEVDLWHACEKKMGHGDLEWFFSACDLDADDQAKVYYLVTNHGMALPEAMEKYDEVEVMEGTLKDYAYELVDEGIVSAEDHVDYAMLGRDIKMDLDGDDERHEMSDREVGEEYASEMDPKTLANYFDVDSLVRDLSAGGDAAEFTFGGTDYVCRNAAEV